MVDGPYPWHSAVADQIAYRTVQPVARSRFVQAVTPDEVLQGLDAAQPAVDRLGQTRRADQQVQEALTRYEPDLAIASGDRDIVVRCAGQKGEPGKGLPSLYLAHHGHVLFRVEQTNFTARQDV